MKSRRFDRGNLRSPVMLPNGWLKADGYLTRVGVLEYRRADGTTSRELRLPEDVFSDATIESFRLVPLTGGHPTKEPGGMLTAENTSKYQRGQVGERLYPEEGFLRGPIMVTDALAIKEILAGASELSCGYECDIEETSGVWMGQPYDCIQRNITGNHVAYLTRGRAGPEVRLHLDGADAEQTEAEPSALPKERTMKVRLDGYEFDLEEKAVTAIEKERGERQAKLDAAETARKKAESEAATAQAKLDAAEKKISELSDPKALQLRIDTRANLIAEARKHLGTEVKLDGLDDQAVKVEVLKKLRPEAKLDGKTADYIAAYYDSTVVDEKQKTPVLDAARAVLDGPGARSDSADSKPTDADAARKKMIEENRNAWKNAK